MSDAYAYLIVIFGILIYTFMFAIKYLKREFTILFLILLGPLSCITYPIDKISDGKAQAYNKWFSEFLFQVIIQPFHLLLYIVLIGTAVEMADANIIYTLICFAIMTPAEKFVKEMFGFRDKLGSPLGAAAAGGAIGALASKAIGALTSKKGGNGGNGGGNQPGGKDDPSNSLPPKTVDRDTLTSGDEGREQSGEQSGEQSSDTGRELPPGDSQESLSDEYGAGPSVADAFQNSDDPVNDAKREALEEKLADGQLTEDELTDEEKEILGRNKQQNEEDEGAGQGTGEEAKESDSDNGQEPEKKKSWLRRGLDKHTERAAAKYGSASRGQRWKRRAGKGIRTIAKAAWGLAKIGTVGMVGAAAATGALLTGNGKEALGIASGVLGYAGKQVLSAGTKTIKGAVGYVKGAAKDYGNLYRDDVSGKIPFIKNSEQKSLESFKSNPEQIQKAISSYKDRHNGEGPSQKELEQDMEDRFMLASYGLSDDQIDKYLPTYQNKVKEMAPAKPGKKASKQEKLDYEKQMAKIREIAAGRAKYTAGLSEAYSGKDYRDSKVMSNAHERIKEGLMKDTGCDEITADKYATEYLTEAGKMKSVSETEIALPSTTIARSKAQSGETSEVKVKVKEGSVNVSEDKEPESRTRVKATLEYQENQENTRRLASMQGEGRKKKENPEITVDSTEAKEEVKRVSRRRELGAKTAEKKEQSQSGGTLDQEAEIKKSGEVERGKEEVAKDAKKQTAALIGEKKD